MDMINHLLVVAVLDEAWIVLAIVCSRCVSV